MNTTKETLNERSSRWASEDTASIERQVTPGHDANPDQKSRTEVGRICERLESLVDELRRGELDPAVLISLIRGATCSLEVLEILLRARSPRVTQDLKTLGDDQEEVR